MADDLHDRLTQIRGVGDATADAILETLDDNPQSTASPDGVDLDAARGSLATAREHLAQGEAGHADKFVRRALTALGAESES